MKSLATALMTAAFVLSPVPASAAEEVSVSQLIETPTRFSGSEVTVVGELVGDYGFRSDGWVWTQLNDDDYVRRPLREGGSPMGANTGIGITMPAEMADGLDEPGGYRIRGPVVRVIGIWKYHDPERRGESFLEVQSLEIVEVGRSLPEQTNPVPGFIGAALLVISGIIWWRVRPEA